MNLFKMRDHQLKPGDIRDPKIPLELERDEHGRLYSVRLRELDGLESISELPRIYINGGKRGFLVGIDPKELIRLLKPTRVTVGIPQ